MCVKCQLSALFRLASSFFFLYVAEIERNPTCHTNKREREEEETREKEKQQ